MEFMWCYVLQIACSCLLMMLVKTKWFVKCAINCKRKSTNNKGGKERQDSAQAKNKALLCTCGAEKLRATVISNSNCNAERLRSKNFEAKVKNLQSQKEKHAVNVSKPLKNDLLTIMSCQNLELTLHVKFFWRQQMHLLHTTKMGRRYHPQVSRFALSTHCSREKVEPLYFRVSVFSETIRTTLNLELVSSKKILKI